MVCAAPADRVGMAGRGAGGGRVFPAPASTAVPGFQAASPRFADSGPGLVRAGLARIGLDHAAFGKGAGLARRLDGPAHPGGDGVPAMERSRPRPGGATGLPEPRWNPSLQGGPLVNRPFETETSTRGVVAVLILLLAAVALVLAAAGSLMRIWNLGETFAQRDDARQPPPGLEAAPQRALQAYVAEKQRLIQSYAPEVADTPQTKRPGGG